MSSIMIDPVPLARVAPIVAEVGTVRLRWHARELRGERTLREAAELVGLNRDELARIERGETKQIQFQTLAKLLSGYHCALADLVEMELVASERPAPLYAAAVAALTSTSPPGSAPGRRAVRRGSEPDVLTDEDEASFAPSRADTQGGHRRTPLGTLNKA